VIPKDQAADTLPKLISIIEPLSLTEEEINILNSLYLSPEQIFAIANQAERIKYHQAELKET
jgi:DNA-binding MarR family transcriptional regulator